MTKRQLFAGALLCVCMVNGAANADQSGFKRPSERIVRLLTSAEPPTPIVHVGAEKIALLHYEPLIDQQRMQAHRLGLAGYRFDPVSGVSGLETLVRRVDIISSNPKHKELSHQWPASHHRRDGARFSFIQFSPAGKYLSALKVEAGKPSQFLVYDLAARQQHVLSDRVNAAWGNPCQWAGDERLLCRMIPTERGSPPRQTVSPVVVEHNGQPLPTRTYSNLLKDQTSAEQFNYFFSSELAYLHTDKTVVPTGIKGGMITEFEAAPQGRFVIITRLQSSYSHLVPAKRFPSRVEIWDLDSAKRLYRSPAFGFGLEQDEEGGTGEDPKSLEWAPGTPVTAGFLQRTEGEDGEETYFWRQIQAPFGVEKAAEKTLARSKFPIKEFGWTSAGTPWFISATEKKGEVAVYAVLENQSKLIWRGVRTKNDGSSALRINGLQGPPLETNHRIFLVTDGLNHDSPRSSATEVNLLTGEQRSLFTSEAGVYEPVIAMLDRDGEALLTSRESADKPPQLMRIANNEITTLYSPPDSYPDLAGVRRKRITYQRADGVELSALMYLPDAKQRKPLPTLIWIYPRDFDDPDQVEWADPRHFQYHRIKGMSPVAAALAGYAVVNYPRIPIIHGEKEDDVYLSQLVMGAEALADHLVKEGISDPKRIAVGGHSYGAFSAANLLVHSDRFATAIAMSGAYNRTLTPFGFQHEKRSFWEAMDYYAYISPFFQANQFNKPILLVHGDSDPNPGTPTLQARRFFHALVGEGVETRYVELPFEEHVYRGEATVLHAAWEMISWLDKTLREP